MQYLTNLWNALDFGSLESILLRLAAVFLCLTIHETCHGLAAYALGDPTAKRAHRLSLNPLRHIDWLGLIMMVAAGFGWAKPVPVDPSYFKKPKQGMALTALAGPVSNFLLALFIYSMILFAWGDQYIKVQEAPLGMDFNETAKSVGFQDGDILLSADGVPFERYDGDMLSQIVDAREVSVLREGKKASVYIPEDMMQRLMADSVRFASFRFPYVVDSVMVNSPAAQAGIQPGDSIIALNGTPISFSDFKEAMAERKQNAETLLKDSIDPRLITLTYVRGGVTDTLNMRVDSAYLMGVTACLVTDRLLPMVKKEYTFFESFPAGVSLGVKTLKGYVGNMKYLFSKEGAKQLGGFGTIGSIFPATWDWHQFWYMTAFLSIILAFMNILPIPALDGGHVLFLFYEMIARRKPSDKFMEYAQMTGMVLLFGLLIWANFNDILRFFF